MKDLYGRFFRVNRIIILKRVIYLDEWITWLGNILKIIVEGNRADRKLVGSGTVGKFATAQETMFGTNGPNDGFFRGH